MCICEQGSVHACVVCVVVLTAVSSACNGLHVHGHPCVCVCVHVCVCVFVCVCMHGRSAVRCTGEPGSDQAAADSVGGEEGGGAAAKTDTSAENDQPVTWSSLGRRVRQMCIDFCPKVHKESIAQRDSLPNMIKAGKYC